MATAQEAMLTTQEVADLVKVSPATVRAWARTGKIGHRELPGGYRFWREDVLRFVNGEEAS